MAGLEVQPWEQWRPPGPGPMQVLGELDHGVYARLAGAGWAWDADEEEWDEFPEGAMVLLLGRDGRSRFLLEAVPDALGIGVRVWGPGDEEREDLTAEVLRELGLEGEPMTLDTTWPEDEDVVDRPDGPSLLASAEQATFPLFGLAAAFGGTREVSGVARDGAVVTHVRLSHGLRTQTRVDVSVTAADPRIGPLRTIAVELLNRTGRRFTGGQELMEASEELLRRDFEDGEIRVDGEPLRFRFLRDGVHWLAVHDLATDHLLYVVASNVEPRDIELTRLGDLSGYA